jgi:hypothetical protein
MKLIVKFSIIIFAIFANVVVYGQTLPLLKFDPEPLKPMYFDFDAMPGLPKIEFLNGKLVTIEETKAEYNKRNAEHKKKLYSDYINTAEYKKWYAEHLIWRSNNPNWKEITLFPELLTQKEKQEINRPKLKFNETYLITSQSLNIRSEANKTSSIIATLKLGDEVKLLNADNSIWWYVSDGYNEGYIFSQYLKLDPNSGWNRKQYKSGETPECENVDPQYDYKLDNYLKVNVGSNTDVVIKLMKKQYGGDICIRMVFIRSNETYYLKNIPEGNYYLKIAYGKDWRQKIVDEKCYGKFMKDAQYEIGDERLDYNLIHQYDRDQVPSFELSLNVIVTRGTKSKFKSNDISEAEFNK